MTTQKNFYGHGDFHHFVGVVEDRQDPQKLGRVRVRVVGLHTHNKEDLPTADLPWSMVALSPTDAGISGLGLAPSFLPEGTHVIGFSKSLVKAVCIAISVDPVAFKILLNSFV